MRTLATVLLLIVPAAVGGCLAPAESSVACQEPTFGALTGPVDPQNGISRETDRTIPTLVRLTNEAATDLEVILPDTPRREGAPADLSQFLVTAFSGNKTLGPNETLFALVEYEGGFQGEFPPFEVRATLRSPATSAERCLNTPSVGDVHTFVGDYVGEVAQPGNGALVYTAGFWTNGTMFYTNMDRVHNDTKFPRAGWYAYEGGDPLPVYVYNATREERPARYNESGFVTTIPGFNEGLKGLSTAGSKVVHLLPEEAYTRPGNEGHDLYGDELVFYIEIKDVVSIDCPLPEPVCEPPPVPPASLLDGGPKQGSSSTNPAAAPSG